MCYTKVSFDTKVSNWEKVYVLAGMVGGHQSIKFLKYAAIAEKV